METKSTLLGSPSKAAPAVVYDTDEAAVNDQPNVATFEGSFAPSARPPQRLKPWYKDRDYFLDGWTSKYIWKAAFVEGVATAGLVYISGQLTGTLISYNTVQIGAYIGVASIFLIITFVYATAAGTGAHMNPMITFSAMLSGICPVPRGILYMCCQTAGAALAGGLLLGVWGRERSIQYHGGGCFYDPSELSSGQAFLSEVVSSFILLYLSYGVGLDPRQALLFGPRLGPLLVGISLGLVAFSNSASVPGYAGAAMHPARCFGFGVAKQNFDDQWIWWFGPAVAAILFSVMYNLIPPKELPSPSTKKHNGDGV
ncbi:aquaporin-like protein [Stachybotrys elegans]|uniref:Aquaporin-like protein n=1 Tax=Stachybotrys elegans TaxID=80388 RepID=A0A8K0WQT1_9HYPO|nr:aquaporin-like protein [Stachybotrys elegans]